MTETTFSQSNPAFAHVEDEEVVTDVAEDISEPEPEPEPEPEGVVFEDATVVVFEDEPGAEDGDDADNGDE